MQQTRLAEPASFPTSPSIRSIWVGVDIAPEARDALDHDPVRRALQRHGSVGCRTTATADLLADAGIDAHVSGCLTTTFPRRTSDPDDGRVFLIDVGDLPLPEQLNAPDVVRMSHEGRGWWSQDAKRVLARDLLEQLRLHARMLVTTKVHAASAAVAIGVPVVFLGDPEDIANEPIEGLTEFIPVPDSIRGASGAARARRRSHWKREMQHHAWIGFAKDIENDKRMRVRQLHEQLAAAGVTSNHRREAA